MSKTSSKAALLHIAAQDLHAGKLLLHDHLPALAESMTDAAFRKVIEAEAGLAETQAQRLSTAAGDMAGPSNLWMTGILDDADRDASSHQPGPILDVALIGAIRKAKAAEIVSSETAIALASETGQTAILAAVTANRDEEIATDRALKERLHALTR
jgi:ferritin-like metal-binding protein YciE